VSSEEQSAEEGKSAFLKDFFDDAAVVQKSLTAGRETVKRMGRWPDEVLQATTSEQDQAASEALHDMVAEGNRHMQDAKQALDHCREQARKAVAKEKAARTDTAAANKIRENALRGMAQKLQLLLRDFQQIQMECKKALQNRQFRELQLACPEATNEEVHGMLAAGETSSMLVAQKMAGTHALLLEEVHRIREKHQDILQLERSVADLNQLFKEAAILVDSQGELLDSIEENVHHANEHTQEAEKELTQTVQIQRNTMKWSCCLWITIIILLVVVFIPMFISMKQDAFSSGSMTLLLVFMLVLLFGGVVLYCQCCGGGCCGRRRGSSGMGESGIGGSSWFRPTAFKKMTELPM